MGTTKRLVVCSFQQPNSMVHTTRALCRAFIIYYRTILGHFTILYASSECTFCVGGGWCGVVVLLVVAQQRQNSLRQCACAIFGMVVATSV